MGDILKNGVVYYTIVKKDTVPGESDTKSARYLLRWMLDYLNIDCPCKIDFMEHGKPYFKGLDVCFNYSHSKNYIACAISNCDVGIDIEDADRKISDRVSKKYLGGEKDDNKIIEKWVKKEAYSKLKGQGISIIRNIDLDNIYDECMFIANGRYVCCLYSSFGVFKEIKFK